MSVVVLGRFKKQDSRSAWERLGSLRDDLGAKLQLVRASSDRFSVKIGNPGKSAFRLGGLTFVGGLCIAALFVAVAVGLVPEAASEDFRVALFAAAAIGFCSGAIFFAYWQMKRGYGFRKINNPFSSDEGRIIGIAVAEESVDDVSAILYREGAVEVKTAKVSNGR